MKKLIIVILLLSLAVGCKIIKPATEHSKTDETKIEYKQQDVKVTGAKVGTELDLDSLFSNWLDIQTSYKRDSKIAVEQGKTPPPPPTTSKQYFTDPATKAQLSYWIDQYGKLQIGCESKDQVVSLLTAEVTRLSKEVTKKTEVAFKTPVWCWIALAVMGTLLLICILIIVFTVKLRLR